VDERIRTGPWQVRLEHWSACSPPKAKLYFNLTVDLFELAREVDPAHLNASLAAANHGPKLTLPNWGRMAGESNSGFDDFLSPLGEAAHGRVWHAQSPRTPPHLALLKPIRAEGSERVRAKVNGATSHGGAPNSAEGKMVC
jgi:hypothetical protein